MIDGFWPALIVGAAIGGCFLLLRSSRILQSLFAACLFILAMSSIRGKMPNEQQGNPREAADAMMARGDHAGASALYQLCSAAKDATVAEKCHALNREAECHFRLGSESKVLKCAASLLALPSSDAKGHGNYWLGALSLKRAKVSDAIERFRTAAMYGHKYAKLEFASLTGVK